MSATPAAASNSGEVVRVGTTEPGAEEIASDPTRTAKKPVKKVSAKKKVSKKKAKSTRMSKASKAADDAAPAAQSGVPTNLAQ